MKVNIEFDSQTKECLVTMDGEVVENVSSVEIMKRYSEDSENKAYMVMRTVDTDSDEKMHKVTTITANEIKVESELEHQMSQFFGG